MALSPNVARQRFARFIGRALRDARARGLTDPEIKKLTGIHPSTFHKWQSGEGGLPKLDKVQAFCRGLDIPPSAAYAALGIDESRGGAALEPIDDPDLRRIGRILQDPSVPEADKQAIRRVLRALASSHADHEPSGRSPAQRGEA